MNRDLVMQMPMIFYDSLQMLRLVFYESLVGSAVIVGCVAIGWYIGRDRQARFVNLISWWLEHVVCPLLVKGTWLKRTVIIAANNSLVCLAVVLLGAVWSLAWLGVVFVGLGLGVAMRLLIGEGPTARDSTHSEIDVEPGTQDENVPGDDTDGPRLGWLATVGVALNLLEIPAIMFSAGLSLGQGSISSAVGLSDALMTFISVVMPMLIVAAAGEALWMILDPHLSERMRSGGM